MKHNMRRVIISCLSILIAINILVYNSLIVYAFPKRLLDGTWIDIPWTEAGEEIYQTIMYGIHQIGAFFVNGADFEQWLKNNEAYRDLFDENGRLAQNVSIDTQTGNVTYNKEIMIVLKNAVDEYAKTEQTKEENGGFYLLPTTKFDEVPVSDFPSTYMYSTFRRIVVEKSMLSVRVNYNGSLYFTDPFSDPDHPQLFYFTGSQLNQYLNNPENRVGVTLFCANHWSGEQQMIMRFQDQNQVYNSCEDAEHINTGSSGYTNGTSLNGYDNYNYTLYSTTGERVRVFISSIAAQNYSVGNRKIFFSENYYNYVPEDLTVAVDDLQKSVDDLQKIIDELLKQINDQTSESEIEELLRQILEELRKNPGGGGGGSGSGDVTVSVDLKETNSWLSKIYNRLGDLLDKIHGSIEDLKQTLVTYLKTITSDLDDIKGQLENMSEEEFSEKSDSFLDSSMESFSEIGEIAKTKFPLSIPYDLYNLLAVISPKPSEVSTYSLLPAEQTVKNYSSPAVYQGNGRIISVSDGAENVSENVQLSSTGAPVFHLPIIVESMGWDYAITVDMSRFQTVANLSRTFFTLIFILGLINLTIKIAGLWGDIID